VTSGERPIVPALCLVATAAAAIAVFAGLGSPLRPIVVLAFLLMCPGLAVVRLLRLGDALAELTIGLAASLAIVGGVCGVVLYAGWWNIRLIFAVVVAITVVAAVLDTTRWLAGERGGEA
jgi:uncharacterized membrane protein